MRMGRMPCAEEEEAEERYELFGLVRAPQMNEFTNTGGVGIARCHCTVHCTNWSPMRFQWAISCCTERTA